MGQINQNLVANGLFGENNMACKGSVKKPHESSAKIIFANVFAAESLDGVRT
jgi:hypothetical protein